MKNKNRKLLIYNILWLISLFFSVSFVFTIAIFIDLSAGALALASILLAKLAIIFRILALFEKSYLEQKSEIGEDTDG